MCATASSVLPSCELAKEALVTAAQCGHPVYDCVYAVLARREGAPVLTADVGFGAMLSALQVPVSVLMPAEPHSRTRTTPAHRRARRTRR